MRYPLTRVNSDPRHRMFGAIVTPVERVMETSPRSFLWFPCAQFQHLVPSSVNFFLRVQSYVIVAVVVRPPMVPFVGRHSGDGRAALCWVQFVLGVCVCVHMALCNIVTNKIPQQLVTDKLNNLIRT